MSIVNKKPYIVEVLDSLDSSSKIALKNLINGGGEEIFRTLYPNQSSTLSSLDKGIKRVKLEVSGPATSQKLYDGYLIYTDDYCVLIAYASNKIQTLTLIDMVIGSSPWEFKIKGCELSITELRSELEDASNITIITADDVDSGSATAGYVLTADGKGGATWEEGGSEIEDATDVLCELTGSDNIPVIAGDLDQNNHLMYANFRHEYGITTIGTSDTGEDLELHAFNYQSVRNTGGTITDVANYNYSDGNIVCHTALEYSEFMTLVGTSILNMGVNQDVEIYDSLNISNPAEIIAFLYKIYQYKIVRLVFADINDMYIEIDNKDVEFIYFNSYPFSDVLLPTTFKGKVHINDNIDIGNVDIIATLSCEEVSSNYQIALRIKAVPHVEENQFLAPEYDTTASYVAGDLCLHLGVLYVCTANTSGTFDDSDWQPTTIAGSVLGLLNTGV